MNCLHNSINTKTVTVNTWYRPRPIELLYEPTHFPKIKMFEVQHANTVHHVVFCFKVHHAYSKLIKPAVPQRCHQFIIGNICECIGNITQYVHVIAQNDEIFSLHFNENN